MNSKTKRNTFFFKGTKKTKCLFTKKRYVDIPTVPPHLGLTHKSFYLNNIFKKREINSEQGKKVRFFSAISPFYKGLNKVPTESCRCFPSKRKIFCKIREGNFVFCACGHFSVSFPHQNVDYRRRNLYIVFTFLEIHKIRHLFFSEKPSVFCNGFYSEKFRCHPYTPTPAARPLSRGEGGDEGGRGGGYFSKNRNMFFFHLKTDSSSPPKRLTSSS